MTKKSSVESIPSLNLEAIKAHYSNWTPQMSRPATSDVVALVAEIERLRALVPSSESETPTEKLFPIQRQPGAKAHRLRIPWSVAEKAYSVYSAKFGISQSLERMAERGGFCPDEMDDFHPTWREESDELFALKAELAELRKTVSLPVVQDEALKAGQEALIEKWRRWGWGKESDIRSDATSRAKAECADELAAALGASRPSPATPFEACDESKATLSDTAHTMRLTAETFGPEAEAQILRWADEIEAAITDPDVGPSPAPKETKS